jgi:hypothetical protein
MTVSSPESDTPRRSVRKAPGQLTPAQSAVLAYAAARAARGLAPQTCHGEGAHAAAAAYAAREVERPASAPGKATRRRAHTVEDYILCAATESRPRVRAHAGTPAARPRRLFKAQGEPAEEAQARIATADGAAAEAPAWLHVSLRVDDTGAAVVCELRLEQETAAGGPSVDELAAALSERLSLRQARVRAPSLSPEVQRLSYLGFCAELRAHVAARGTNTLSTAAVRRWLTNAPEAAGFVDKLVAAHGVASFADLQIDHIVSARFGGADCVYNFFIMPRALNASFNSDGACSALLCWQPRADCSFPGRSVSRESGSIHGPSGGAGRHGFLCLHSRRRSVARGLQRL